MWQGKVTFGIGWFAFHGASDQQAPHAHSALQLAVAHSGRVTVESCGQRHSAPGLMIAPRVQHLTLPSDAPLIFVYADPHSPLGRHLTFLLAADRIAAAPRSMVTILRDLGPTDSALQKLIPAGTPTRPLDSRLSQALERLESDLGSSAVVARAAKKVGISPARLRAIASTELGLPLEQWTLWRKLARASASVAKGRSFADAALAGGFADQALFSRVMKRMFGVTPREASIPLRSVRKR